MTCTWVGCSAEATHPLVAKDGEEWANLCEAHWAEHEEGVKAALDPGGLDAIKRITSNWVKAGGGPKKMAARMVGGEP